MVELRHILLSILLTAAVAVVQGQAPPTLQWSADRDSVGLGDPLVLTLTSDEPLDGGRHWDWPALQPGDSLPQGWEVIEASPVDSSASPALEAGLRRTQTIVVMAWDTGMKVLEPLALTDSLGVSARTEARLVEVGLVRLGTDAVPKPMQGFKAYSWTLWERILQGLPWLLGVLSAMALAFWAFRRWSARETLEPGVADVVEAPIPAHITALAMLRKLESESPWRRGEGKEAQAILSEAVRLHLQGSFGVKALERTTDELARSLRDAPVRGMDAEQCQWVIALLERSDLVKFAKQDLDGDAHLRVVQESIQWVETTAPAAEPEDPPSVTSPIHHRDA